IGHCVHDVLMRASKHAGEDGTARHPRQQIMVGAVEHVIDGNAALDLVGLDQGLEHIVDEEGGATGCTPSSAYIVSQSKYAGKIIGRMASGGPVEGIVVVQPTYHAP